MFPQERERELLDSLKQSEIANVVTKGLNPNVRMKDSGIFGYPKFRVIGKQQN